MSWSSGRDLEPKISSKKAISEQHKVKLESIRQINGVLNMLASDEDLQDDLKLASVRTALDHWTGIRRLPPEVYSKKLENDRRVNAVYPKLKLLQSLCSEANIKVPLDHMLDRKRELDSYMLTTSFGTDFCILHDLTRPLTPKNDPRNHESSGKLLSTVSRKLSTESEKEDKKDSSDKPNLKNTEAFSIWKKIVEACDSADWLGILSRSLKQQFLVLLVTIGIAYLLGYISLERLWIFLNFTKET